MIIRHADTADCDGILRIWNPVIRETDLTFNDVAKTPVDLADLLTDKRERGQPFLVADHDGEIRGFATYGQFRNSSGYRKTAEHTIILSPTARGEGLGRRLLTEIESLARSRDIHSMIAAISHSNKSGVGFHAALGYREIARLPEVGRKFNRWFDLVLMQKLL